MTTEGFWPGSEPAAPQQTQHQQIPQAQHQPQQPQQAPAQPQQTPAAPPQTEAPQQPEPQPQQPQPAQQEQTVEPAAAAPEAPAAGSAHAPADLALPEGVETMTGHRDGAGRTVAIVVSRFNGEVTNHLLASALTALAAAGVPADRVTVMPVPGAFELPLGAMALAKTRRFACIVALGCIIRGETAHFDYVASEAASGLQLAGLETGVPVAFGVLTVDTLEQALARADKGAEAVGSALEMADLFSQIRASARATG